MPYKRKDKCKKPWLGQVMVNNKPIRRAFLTKKEAKKWEVEQQKKVISLTLTTSLGEWALEYLTFAEEKFSRKTYLEKAACFRRFFSAFDKEKDACDLVAGGVLKHLTTQKGQRSGHAANKDRKNLVAAWEWGMKYFNLPAINPCKVERFPEIRSPRYVPIEKDFWKVYEQSWTDQDATMLLAYLHLAARKSELFRLTWDDVDFEEMRIRLYTRKTKDGSWEEAWLPMTDDLKDSLTTQRQKEMDKKWVFIDPESGYPYMQRRHWMKNLCRRAKVRHFGLHAIRHLTASILAKAGTPMIDIQTILRHKNLSTTERYIRRLDSIRPALDALPGLKQKNHQTTTRNSIKLKVAI